MASHGGRFLRERPGPWPVDGRDGRGGRLGAHRLGRGQTFDDIQKKYGFLPNLYREFAHAPVALDAYLAVSDIFSKGTLSATERNVVLLAASRENGCHYCVAVHSTVADMQIRAAEQQQQALDDVFEAPASK